MLRTCCGWRQSSLLTVEMLTLSENFRHLYHAREQKVCLVSESEVRVSQRVAIRLRRRIPGGNVAGSRSRCAVCGRRRKLKQQWSALVKKLVAPSVPTAADPEEHTARAHAVFRTRCRECCIGRVQIHQHRSGGRETAILAIAIDYGYLNERDDQLQETAGAPIFSKCDRDRWIGAAIVPTKCADEHAIAELKNDVSGSGLAEVRVRSGTEQAILALKESTATALKLAGVNVKVEECALYDSQSNGLAESAVVGAKDAVRTNLACLVRRFGREFPGGHPVLPLLVKYSAAMVNRCRRGPHGL